MNDSKKDIKMYGIEERGPNYYGSYEYRFYSLYNGMRGDWRLYQGEAIEDGEVHQQILLLLHHIKEEQP